ncbi:F-box/kelch-repeat protein SKIP25 [Striga hermonthica]|uniref:F-box/kelch-repeat protein SKIP25 n=1 Tax=Striga hermonthica TaxID=68872 RepID=A0A9N7MX10_STRHE|nr:F-box/kelch-repeat protein SKIP25 [Striga hermonthica]
MDNPTSSDFPFARSTAVKLTHHGSGDDDQPLLPGLPDHIAHLCLSLVPPSVLYSVCRSWRRLIYSQSFPPFLSLYAVAFPSVAASPPDTLPDPIEFRSFDPISRRWSHLPPPPSDPDPPRFLFRHPSFICRDMPVQSVSAAGTLVVLAATDDLFLPALPIPLVFDPLAGSWCCGPRIPAPRRWCVAGSAGGAVYVAGGPSVPTLRHQTSIDTAPADPICISSQPDNINLPSPSPVTASGTCFNSVMSDDSSSSRPHSRRRKIGRRR